MKHPRISPSIRTGLLAGIALMSGLGHAMAGPLDLRGGCAVGGGALHGGGGHLQVDRLEVTLPGQPDAAFHAARLDASIHGAPVPTDALQQAGTAAAAAMLVAVSGHRGGACPVDAFRAAAAPLARAIGAGGNAVFAWTAVSVRAGDKRLGAQKLVLHVDGGGADARIMIRLDGAVSNEAAAALLPNMASVTASLPAAEIPNLLSAAGGSGDPVDVRIEALSARRGSTVLTGNGQARIAADAADSGGTAHVVVQDYDAVLDAAGAPGLEKLRTGLFLAKLMAHHQGDAVDWDLSWQGGTLLVNNVPLPIR